MIGMGVSLVAQMIKNDPGSIPGSGRSPGEGHGNLLQYSCLENSMDSPWGCKVSGMSERLTHKHKGYIASFAYADSSQCLLSLVIPFFW